VIAVADRAAEGAVVDVGILGEHVAELVEALLIDRVGVAVEQVLDLEAIGTSPGARASSGPPCV
jgi:hypothetical protein